ncbi:hypothetical protein ACFPOE_05270 [Caenimonas terrae]|uniref:Uncharacterized protein n=1 Tax=Caenimonas terrae TaxID=696074 RepID=A0ABW0ND26_9BURK
MSKSAFSVQAFGVYIIALGLGLVFVPNLLLGLFRMPAANEVWIRVLGVVVMNIGILYVVAARANAVPVFRATVYGRPAVLAWFAAFVLLGLAPPMLLLFGAVEVAGALWTWWALRAEQRASQRVYPASRIDPRYDTKM